MKILALDDDEGLLQALRLMLEQLGHSVDLSNNAVDAVQLVASNAYDFVLVDYKMPVNDGIWFMKNSKIPRQTKVLLMTGYLNRRVINEMFELGAVGYIVKPFDVKDLLRHLEFHSSRV